MRRLLYLLCVCTLTVEIGLSARGGTCATTYESLPVPKALQSWAGLEQSVAKMKEEDFASIARWFRAKQVERFPASSAGCEDTSPNIIERLKKERHRRAKLYVKEFNRLFSVAERQLQRLVDGEDVSATSRRIKSRLDALLNEGLHSASAALDLGRREAKLGDTWLTMLNRMVDMTEFLSEALRSGQVTEWSPQFSGFDVIQFANKLCTMRSEKLQQGVLTQLKGTQYARGLQCQGDSESGSSEGEEMGVEIGSDLIVNAMMLPPPQTEVQQEQLARLGLESLKVRLNTWSLWPTLISSVQLAGDAQEDAAFLERLNKAAQTAYRQFMAADPEEEFKPCSVSDRSSCSDNDQFYHWQGAHQGGGQFEDRLNIGAADWQRLRSIAVHGCLAHVISHRRVQSIEDLGWPDHAHFQMWASVLGGASGSNDGHADHTHHKSACSGAFYSKAPADGRGAPIMFTDPRGTWGEPRSPPSAPFHQQYTFFPKEGQMVVFPSWLVHRVGVQEVEPGGERIAWSFNVVGDSMFDAWTRTAV